jgi:hypothetical protein
MSAFAPSTSRPRDPQLSARFAIASLIVSAAVAAVAALAISITIGGSDEPVIVILADRVDLPSGALALQRVSAIVSAVTYLTWLMWQYRVHANAKQLTPDRVKTSPAWGVLCWFVPFVNLVKPYLVIREISRAGSPRGRGPGARLTPWWWACWLGGYTTAMAAIASLVIDVIEVLNLQPDTQRASVAFSERTMLLFLAAEILVATAALLGAVIVRAITAAQTASIDAESREPDRIVLPPPARPDLV